MPDDPYQIWREIDRQLLRELDRALQPFEGTNETWAGDDLAEWFINRLTTLCALSFITPRQRDIVALWRTVFTPEQIEQLTHLREPKQARDRRLTQGEVARITHLGERTVRDELSHARDVLEKQLSEESLPISY